MKKKKSWSNENYRVLPNALILLREKKKKKEGKNQDNKQESEGFRLKKP